VRTCAVCRSPSNAFLCDDPACRVAHNTRAREYQRKKRAEYAARGESYRDRWARDFERKSNTHCIDCGAPVRWGRTQETRCRGCGHRAYQQRKAAEQRRGRHRRRAAKKLERAAVGVSRDWVFVQGRCASCGEQFACMLTNSPGRFCSKTCSRREAKALRRARQKGADVTPGQRWQVYERDNWICRICGDPVDRAAAPGDLAEPTVDHRIPLDRGGAHAMENWQTAHRYCNSWKSNRIGVEFAEVAA
jgi:DNA-directed RNA polymerase subunit RPC12/RpoP